MKINYPFLLSSTYSKKIKLPIILQYKRTTNNFVAHENGSTKKWARNAQMFLSKVPIRICNKIKPFGNLITANSANYCTNHVVKIRQSTLICWDKWLVDQASDFIIFFHNFLQNSLKKLFQFIFLFSYNFTRTKIKSALLSPISCSRHQNNQIYEFRIPNILFTCLINSTQWCVF